MNQELILKFLVIAAECAAKEQGAGTRAARSFARRVQRALANPHTQTKRMKQKNTTTLRTENVAAIHAVLKIPMSAADLAGNWKKLARDLVRDLPLSLGGVVITADIRRRKG